MVRTVREEDMVARLGDSEIGILLMHSPAEGAREMTKRLIRELESLSFYNGDQVEHIHLCAGIASYPMVSDMNVNADGLIRYTHAIVLHQARLRDDEAVMEEGGRRRCPANHQR
ncbi:MAG: diguanylate cyclase [Vampirovibrionales bacterium]